MEIKKDSAFQETKGEKKYEPISYIFKEPDLKGGFIYTSIENLHVVERDNKGNIIGIRPFNLIKKGIETDKGKVIEVTEKNVILDKNDKLMFANKYLFNSYLLKKSIELKDDLGISEIISKRENRKEKSFIRKALGGIISAKDFTIPKVSINNNAGNEDNGAPKVDSGGVQWNVKGGIKPGHKWIERKQSETNPDEYIYLYELPSGQRQWKDATGKDINADVPNDLNNINKESYNDYINKIGKGDRINYNGQSGKIVENGDKLMVVESRLGRIVIDKQQHETAVRQHETARPNDIIDYKGQKAKVLPTKDFDQSETMLLQTEDRKWHEVKRETKIRVTASESKARQIRDSEEIENNDNIFTPMKIAKPKVTNNEVYTSLEDFDRIEESRPLTIKEERLKKQMIKQDKIEQVWKEKQLAKKNREESQIKNEINQKENLKILESDEYKEAKQSIESKGYKILGSGFVAQNKVKVNGLDYRFEAEYVNGKWETRIVEGAYRDLVMNGKEYPIVDMDELDGGHVIYNDNNENKKISVNELKEINGAKALVPITQNEGLVSTKVQTRQLLIGGKIKVPYHTEILEAEDIIPSSIIDGDSIINNPKYTIEGAQNRERKGTKDMIIIQKIASNPDFDQLDDTHIADFGAPVLNANNEILGGNGRFLGINEHYKLEGQKYKEDLMREAESLGFDPEEISKMKNPVLVRMTNVTHDDSASIGVQTNAEGKATQSEVEIAKAKIAQMTPEMKKDIDGLFRKTLEQDEWKDEDTIRKLLENKELGAGIFQILTHRTIDQNGKYVDGVITDYETKKYWDSERDNVVKDTMIPILFGILYNGAGRYLSNIPSAVEEGLQMGISSVLSMDEEKSPLFRSKLNEAISIIGKYNKAQLGREMKNQPKLHGTALNYIESINNIFDGEAIADPVVCGLVNMLENSKPTEIKNNLKKIKDALYVDFFAEGQTVEEAVLSITPPPESYKNGIHLDLLDKSIFYKLKKTFINLIKSKKL